MSVVAVDRVALSELLGRAERRNAPWSVIEDRADQEPVLPFNAWRQESSGTWWPIVVTGLMERTAAFHVVGDRYDTGVLRFDLVHVEPDTIEWKPKAMSVHAGKVGSQYRSYRTNAAPAAGQRELSDKRALADQARKAEARREETQMAKGQISVERRAELTAQGLKHCFRCNQDKPVGEFRSNGYCKPCGAAYDKARVAKKPGAGPPAKVKKAPIKSVAKSQPANSGGIVRKVEVVSLPPLRKATLTEIIAELQDLDQRRRDCVERAIEALRAMVPSA